MEVGDPWSQMLLKKLDSAVHWINHYPVGKYLGNQMRYPVDSDLSGA